jgi:hypothetical protein
MKQRLFGSLVITTAILSLLLSTGTDAHAQGLNKWQLSISMIRTPTWTATSPSHDSYALGFVTFHNFGSEAILMFNGTAAIASEAGEQYAHGEASYFYSVYPYWDGNQSLWTPYTYTRIDTYATGVGTRYTGGSGTSATASSLQTTSYPQGDYSATFPGPSPGVPSRPYLWPDPANPPQSWPNYDSNGTTLLSTVYSGLFGVRGGAALPTAGAEGGVLLKRYSFAITQAYLNKFGATAGLPLSYGGRPSGVALDVTAQGDDLAVASLVLNEHHSLF